MIDQSQESKFRKFHLAGPRLGVGWCFNIVVHVFAPLGQFCWCYETLCVLQYCLFCTEPARQPDRRAQAAFSLVEISEKCRPSQSYGDFLKRRWLDITDKKKTANQPARWVWWCINALLLMLSEWQRLVITTNTGFVYQDSTGLATPCFTSHHTLHWMRSFWDWTHLQPV